MPLWSTCRVPCSDAQGTTSAPQSLAVLNSTRDTAKVESRIVRSTTGVQEPGQGTSSLSAGRTRTSLSKRASMPALNFSGPNWPRRQIQDSPSGRDGP